MDFKQPYNRAPYLSFLRTQLLPEDFVESEEKISLSFQPNFIKNIIKLGESSSLDLCVYEVEHPSENDPRVSLSRDAFRLMAQYDKKRALIFLVSKNSRNFRLSLVTIDLKWEEGKRVQKGYSNPRRYSFFLGPETKVHTPEEYLVKKGRVKDFEDLKNRFSIEVVNKEFYTEIAMRFSELAGGKREIGRKSIDAGDGTLKLPSTNDDTLRKEFAVRLIGRLVFCWFLKKKKSDKGLTLLSEDLLSTKAGEQNKGYYHQILEPLFFEVLNTQLDRRDKKYKTAHWGQIPFLNGGLFNPHLHDFYEPGVMGISKHINTLKIPDNWFKELFEIFETYNFTIDENTSVDVELSIEPEMLGRIFENLLAEINPETGETARKATGSYYTPRPIVEYMVDESLKQYLLTKTNLAEEKITGLLMYDDTDVNLIDADKKLVIDALDSIKIIDPACGSGAFPMGILQKMLLILLKVDPDSQKWLEKILSKIGNSLERKMLQSKLEKENVNYTHKLGIIRDAIYGVDIQPIAVEISKLRFFLSLIVDEKVNDAKENRSILPLPNLEFKFVCANSLIGLPPKPVPGGSLFPQEDIESITKLKALRDQYLSSVGSEKKDIEKEFLETQSKMRLFYLDSLIKPQQNLYGSEIKLKKQEEPLYTKMLGQWNPFSEETCSWFDSEWMFGIKEGFDIVIANPPYVQIKQISWEDRKVYENKFESAVGRFNLFYFFLELSSVLARKHGVSTFIIPDRLLLNTQCDELRNWLLKEQTILEIDSFEEGVFDAVVDSIILIYKNTRSDDEEIKVKNRIALDQLAPSPSIRVPATYFLESPSSQFDLSYNMINAALLQKIKKQSVPLTKISETRDGIIQSKIGDELFLTKKIDSDSKKLLFGKDIVKFKVSYAGNWVNYKPDEMMRLELKKVNGAPGLRLRNKEIFERSKILTRQTADEVIAAYDEDHYYYSNTLHGTTITDKNYHPLYVLGVLNSKLMTWYYRSTTAEQGKVFAQVKIKLLRLLPIMKADALLQKPIILLVQKIIDLSKHSDGAKELGIIEQLNQQVYKLYKLTKDEIKIVEGLEATK